MIIYADIMSKLRSAGYTSTRILRENILPQSTMQRLREGKPVNLTTIDALCRLLSCQPSDLISYVPDE